MGVKQSKRSVDITETSTKGEIEGFGNEGKVEKIIDGVVEKVAANGHVDGELQNGIEPVQNGVEVIQNGEAATVATEKIKEKKDADEAPVEGVVNGQVETNGELNGEAEKSEEEKKTDEKKGKKKEKKGKTPKAKFSFRALSFTKKDKSKPVKEEKSSTKVDEAETEEAVTSPDKEIVTSSQEEMNEKPEEPTKPATKEAAMVSTTAPEEEAPAPEKPIEMSTKMTEELPPPLPASPPPSEPIEGKLAAEVDKLDISEPASEKSSEEIHEVTSSMSNVLAEPTETMQEIMKNTEQMAMETGKQIEEKATNLLKAVEERAAETLPQADATAVVESAEVKEEVLETETAVAETKEVAVDEDKKLEETMAGGIPVEISNVADLSPKVEEPTEKHEEGAGESLADMPKDLTDEVTAAANNEVSTPDSLEISATLPPPPPVVEPVTGE